MIRRLPYLIASLAALAGVLAIAFGVDGYYKLESTERFLNQTGYFGSPDFGNVSSEQWRSGYIRSMIASIGLGVLSVTAATGLFLRRRWGEYVWFIILGLLMLDSARSIPYDSEAWILLLVCAVLGLLSWLVFRNSRGHESTAP